MEWSIEPAMDSETAEYYLDLETGEIRETPRVDLETGERDCRPLRRFRIPQAYRQRRKKRKPRRLKADPQEAQLIAAAIFLLPTAVLFRPLLAIVALSVELVLHAWSHKRNKRLQSEAVFFRSPLHAIVKEFCGRCKDADASVEISRLQDVRKDRLKNYIRRIVT